ncbi:Vacuolar protein sorting-associated protein 17 [Rhizina undulata]
MDYSALTDPGFGDPSESPFHNPHSAASSTLVNNSSVPTRTSSPLFDPYAPSVDSHGFASPSFIGPQEDDLRSPGGFGDGLGSPTTATEGHEPQSVSTAERDPEVPPATSQERAASPANRRQVPQYKLQAKITALERTGRKDPIMRFDVHTNLPKFRTTQFRDVRRTHSEFQKLAHHLLSSNPECIVPAVPPPSTSAGVGTDEDEARVKASMQRWLNTICSSEVLIRDDEMVFFVESDFGYSPVVRRKQPATGVRRRVIKQFAPPPDDTPELEEARPVVKAFYLGTMEVGQKVDRVVKSRRGLGLAETELGTRLASLPQIEAHQGLSNAFRKLGKTIQSIGDFHAAQATAESTTLADPLNYHSSNAFIVKETLTNRQILMRELESARRDTKSRLQTAEVIRNKTSIKKDKVDEAISALEEAKTAENHLAERVQRITANLVAERRKYFRRTSKDLRAEIREYCLRQIEAERRTLATLEAVRPDIRAIDSSGGLSRLGRDAPPASRRASIAASQGPRGDAWSGVQRVEGVRRGENGFGIVGVGKIREEEEEGEEDRLDARNAAERLAGSTF